MTREERLRAVQLSMDTAMRRLDGTPQFTTLQHRCVEAIVGAAALLDRDPVALAELLADGRLAEYIEAAEGAIPLPLDDPTPARVPVEDLLREAAEWAESERARFETGMRRILTRYDRTAAALRSRALQARRWQCDWRNTRSIHGLGEDWRRRRGLSDGTPEPATPDER